MSNSVTRQPGVVRGLSLPAALRLKLIAALSTAAVLEIVSRTLDGIDLGDSLLTELISIVAVVLACVSVVILVSRACASRGITALMVLAASALTAAILLRSAGDIPALAWMPVIGGAGYYHGLVVSVTDLAGIAAWLFGFFWLVFELDRTKADLGVQREELVKEIGERKNAEVVLRESEARFRAVFDHVAASIMTMTPQGVLIECNQAMAEELGYSLRQLHGTGLDLLLDDRDLPAFREALETLPTADPPIRRFEAHLICRNETVLRFEFTATLIRPEAGHAGVVVAVLENLTARRLREQQLQQRQKMESLGVLAGGIAHDFNNLLVGIMANAELLARDLASEPERVAPCTDIVRSSQRAADLCQQLLAYAGKAPRSEQALDLSNLVETSQDLLRMALTGGAALEVQCAPGLPAVCADPAQIRQVLMSLITNACDALGGEAGVIRIRTGALTLREADFEGLIYRQAPEPGEYVYLEVQDSGAGMDEDALSRIFDPFYTTKHRGSGLGLPAVLGIVHAHRGMLSLQSSPGRGATFRIYFVPSHTTAAPIMPDAGLECGTSNGAVVLLVDDEEMVRNAALRILEHSGYTVITATDGIEGVELFQKHHANLAAVLLDLTMPRMDGETACKKMRAIDHKVPIILSSGYSANESSNPAIFNEVAGYLRKPYRIKQLLDMLNKVQAS